MDSYESVLLVKHEVFVFDLPPRPSNRGYRAADWNLAQPRWTGRMRLVVKDNKCVMKLEDKASGELFAKCPIETYPGIAIESVTDSSRYFVIRLEDDQGRTAFVGIGFGDRSDSFDLNVALQDHFKWLKKEHDIENEPSKPQLDLAFKEGETIKINMKISKSDNPKNSKVTKSFPTTGTIGVLAPPPAAAPRELNTSGGTSKGPTPLSSPAHAPMNKSPQSDEPKPASQASWVQF